MAFSQQLVDGILSLFENTYKSNGDSKPDLTGNVLIPMEFLEECANDPNCLVEIDGVQCLKLRVAAWDKGGGANKPILSGKITPFKPNETSKPPTTKKAFSSEGRRKLT